MASLFSHNGANMRVKHDVVAAPATKYDVYSCLVSIRSSLIHAPIGQPFFQMIDDSCK